MTPPPMVGATWETALSTALPRHQLTRKRSPHGVWRSSMHGDGGGLRTVIDEAIVRTPNFTLHGSLATWGNDHLHSGRPPLTTGTAKEGGLSGV